MTNSDMQPFAMPTGDFGPVLSNLDPSLGADVQSIATKLKCIITQNGQYFPISVQGIDGLKSLYSNVPVCNETTAHNSHTWYMNILYHMPLHVVSMYIHISASMLQRTTLLNLLADWTWQHP